LEMANCAAGNREHGKQEHAVQSCSWESHAHLDARKEIVSAPGRRVADPFLE
jgi:hypothetical protein